MAMASMILLLELYLADPDRSNTGQACVVLGKSSFNLTLRVFISKWY
ncbi:MAG: hypothetical protein F2MM_02715 [Candidatus Midichloria mitochondrii]